MFVKDLDSATESSLEVGLEVLKHSQASFLIFSSLCLMCGLAWLSDSESQALLERMHFHPSCSAADLGGFLDSETLTRNTAVKSSIFLASLQSE